MKRPIRASVLLLMAAAFARPAAAQTQPAVPPTVQPETVTSDDTVQVQLQLQPDSLVAEPMEVDSARLAWLQTAPDLRDLVCDRIGCFETDVPHTFNGMVMSYVTYFTSRNRTYTQRVLERENLYFPLFEKYLAKYGLPQDLKYLSVVESALIPTAKSKVGATGLWQFMGPTAGDLRLKRDEWVDERMNPEKSTEAACKHLRYLYGMFHDWELVLAAYNWGAGNMQRVMRRTGKKKFWELYPNLPKETRNYVPTFTAIMYAMKYAEQHQLHSPELKYQYAQEMDTLQLGGRAFDLTRMSQALGLDSVAMRRFNPELRRSYLPDNYRPYALQYPASARPLLQEVGRATLFDFCRPQSALPQPLQPLPVRLAGVEPFPKEEIAAAGPPRKAADEGAAISRTRRKVHTVKRGQDIAELAEWYGVSAAQLRRWNDLPKGRGVKPGQKLVVFLPAKDNAPAETTVAVVAKKPAAPAVAAAPRTPAEMGVRVTKRPVVAADKPGKAETEAEMVTDAASEPALVKASTRVPLAATEKAEKEPAPEPATTETAAAQVQNQQAAAVEYVVRKGDYLTKLARERGVSVEQLVAWNNLKTQVVTPGQKLRLAAPADSEAVAEAPAAKTVASRRAAEPTATVRKATPELPPRVHIVQPGDTLYNISRRYQGVTVEQLRKLNHLKTDEVKLGQKLIVASL
ncbi:LysM peptidoglycan-binding domain-containing protein [Hymenobacter busanensis]|uniref:LysM peptidoglycan-binding domain-containing protein n=1 Tax=Hymenobacter busanensis TaxID=2607656 RepID=A0A7L4ZX30_9BACT|nr:LysM peptidoglycan-binding domain-containing protein [Hymenobacter busanensis]KAA9325531.1 LysM peptidoglycan-binding domain-containing protein [Hymenobacter busanensis]QHJ07798.1 LysM peptidoglycan-binding domain-containing protein [Hymenobacter busanensis]